MNRLCVLARGSLTKHQETKQYPFETAHSVGGGRAAGEPQSKGLQGQFVCAGQWGQYHIPQLNDAMIGLEHVHNCN